MKKSNTFKFSCLSVTLAKTQFSALLAMDYCRQPKGRTGDALFRKGLVVYEYTTRHPGGNYCMTGMARALIERVETGRITIPLGW